MKREYEVVYQEIEEGATLPDAGTRSRHASTSDQFHGSR